MNKIVEVLTTPLVTFPLILIGMNAIIYQIAGKKIGKIWGATTAIWFISAANLSTSLIVFTISPYKRKRGVNPFFKAKLLTTALKVDQLTI